MVPSGLIVPQGSCKQYRLQLTWRSIDAEVLYVSINNIRLWSKRKMQVCVIHLEPRFRPQKNCVKTYAQKSLIFACNFSVFSCLRKKRVSVWGRRRVREGGSIVEQHIKILLLPGILEREHNGVVQLRNPVEPTTADYHSVRIRRGQHSANEHTVPRATRQQERLKVIIYFWGGRY